MNQSEIVQLGSAFANDLTLQAFCHPETGAKMIYALV